MLERYIKQLLKWYHVYVAGCLRSGLHIKITRGLITSLFMPWLLLFFSCTGNTAAKKDTISRVDASKKPVIKPPATYQDTIELSYPAAVFYYPDSLQLKKIKAVLDTNVYKAVMHDYFYQMRYAHIVIKKEWPRLAIIECKRYRYLLFVKKDGSQICVDLDTKGDSYGLFVFDGNKTPIPIDMTNLETQVSFYLKQ